MSAYLPFMTDLATPVAGWSLKAILVADYIQDLTHEVLSDVVAYEVSGTGYTAGGIAVTGAAVYQNDSLGVVSLSFDPLDFGAIDVPGLNGVIVYNDTGDTLVAADVFEPVDATASTNFTYTPHADGFLVMAALVPE